MIQPDARSRFTPQDLSLVLQLTWPGQAEPAPDEVEGWLARGDLDELLDEPQVAAGLRDAPVPGPSPSLFFYVLVRHALLARGVEDRRMADYCAALLREFGIRDRATRVARVDDHQHRYLVDILHDLAASSGDRQFRVLVHLGNYALWTAGLFPGWIEARRDRRGGPGLSYYDALGSRGYAEASDHWLAGRVGLEDVLRATAERFGEVRSALNDVGEQLRMRAA